MESVDYLNGDLNTSIIKTHVGCTVMVQWDETSPRPYTRLNLVQGTKGTLAGYPTRVALEGGVEGITEDHHSWVEGEQLEKVFENTITRFIKGSISNPKTVDMEVWMVS